MHPVAGREATRATLRVLIQGALLLPALAAVGVLPMLFLAVPELLAEGNWRGAAFNGLALPGFLAVLASVVLPQGWQVRRGLRQALIVGLLMAGAACASLVHILLIGPDGGPLPTPSATPLALIGGPLIVACWNLRRLSGKAFTVLAAAGGLFLVLTLLLLGVGALDRCTREYDATTGEHTVCR